jgi:hypothetical protein
MEWEQQQCEADEANMQALREQQAREMHERQRTLDTGIENRTLVETQVAATEAHKQEILQSPFPNGIEDLESRARILTALDQIIVSTLVKCPLSAAEEQAERTLAEENWMLIEERWTQKTRIQELQ